MPIMFRKMLKAECLHPDCGWKAEDYLEKRTLLENEIDEHISEPDERDDLHFPNLDHRVVVTKFTEAVHHW